MALSTVSGMLHADRAGQARPARPLEPAIRYERARPGELLHIDVKKLGRIAPASRPPRPPAPAPAPAHPARGRHEHRRLGVRARLRRRRHPPGLRRGPRRREGRPPRSRFLHRAVAFYRRHGITVERVMTDNGSAYRSTIHAIACRALGIRHLRTRPYRPRTNGKAERFIRTMLAGWAYGAIYRDSTERTAALDGWLWTLQPSPTTRRPRPQAPDRSPQRAEQPPRDLHLGLSRRRAAG